MSCVLEHRDGIVARIMSMLFHDVYEFTFYSMMYHQISPSQSMVQ